jgi:hypothetical protein
VLLDRALLDGGTVGRGLVSVRGDDVGVVVRAVVGDVEVELGLSACDGLLGDDLVVEAVAGSWRSTTVKVPATRE